MSMQLEAVRAFHAIPMFSALSEEETFEILRICRADRKPAGTVIFRQGNPGDSAFIIESGQIDVVIEENGRRDPIARLGAGDVLGELALIDPGPRSATAVVVADAVLYELPGPAFAALREQMSPAAFKVVRHLTRVVCQRLRVVNDRIEAQLTGRTPPPLHAGSQAQRDARRVTAQTPAAPATPATDPNESSGIGAIKRLLGRFWGSGGEP